MYLDIIEAVLVDPCRQLVEERLLVDLVPDLVDVRLPRDLNPRLPEPPYVLDSIGANQIETLLNEGVQPVAGLALDVIPALVAWSAPVSASLVSNGRLEHVLHLQVEPELDTVVAVSVAHTNAGCAPRARCLFTRAMFSL